MAGDPEKKKGLVRDFKARWSRVSRVDIGKCPFCGNPLKDEIAPCSLCGGSREGVSGITRPPGPAPVPPPPEPLPEPVGEELEIKKDERDWKAWIVQGDIYYNSGHLQKALEAYDRSLSIRPSFEALNNKGLVLHREGRHAEALECFEKAVELNPDDENLWYHRGNVLRELGRHTEAMDSYDRAISLKPNFERAWAAAGHALLAMGRNEEAIICFESALRIQLDNEHTWHAIGSALLRMKRYDEAETALAKAVEIRPDYWEAWYERAALSLERGRFQEAIEFLRKVTEHNPRHWRSWLELGALLMDKGDEREALLCYSKASENSAGRWEVWRALGQCYLGMKRYQEASAAFTKATELNPANSALLQEAAEAHYLAGRPELTVQAAEKALALGETSQALLTLGTAFLRTGRFREALERLDKAASLDAGSPRVWLEKANAHKMLGERDKALEACERALSLNPRYERALGLRSEILFEMGRWREALEAADAALALRPSLEKLERIAELREMLIIAEAEKWRREAPLPEAAPLTPEELVRLGLEAGAPAVSPPPPVEVQPPEALPPEELVAVEAEALPEAVPELREGLETEEPAVPGLQTESLAAVPAKGEPEGAGAPVAEVGREVEEPGPIEFELVERPLVSRDVARPPARRPSMREKGLTNGLGLTNGRVPGVGIGAGRSLSNGRSGINGRGLTNGRGIINGRGVINGRGAINGRGLINGKGIINGRGPSGRQGLINGVPPEAPGPYAARLRSRRARRNMRLAATVLAAAALILALPFAAMILMRPVGIEINGDFSDWLGIPSLPDSFEDMVAEPRLNILNVSTVVELGRAFFRVDVVGRILDGPPDGVDVLRVFIDADSSSRTGYLIAGIGADRLIEAWGYNNTVRGTELRAFNASRPRLDWNGWNLIGSASAAARGRSAELGAALSDLGLIEGRTYLCVAELDDGKGHRDVSDLVLGSEGGALLVEQSGLVPEVVNSTCEPLPILRASLRALVAEVPLCALLLEPLGTSRDRPTALLSLTIHLDTNRNGVVDGGEPPLATAAPTSGGWQVWLPDPLVVTPGKEIELLVSGLLRPDAGLGSPVGARIPAMDGALLGRGAATIRGGGSLGFVISHSPGITIDGFFSDWAHVTILNDTDDALPPDIDILHYAFASDSRSLSFYMDVEGEMLGGNAIPALARGRPGKPSPVQPGPPPVPLPLPVVTGEDTAAVLIDADRNPRTGVQIWGGIGADFCIQVRGREGRVTSAECHRANASGGWEQIGPVPAGADGCRLETQVTFGLLGIPPSQVDAVLYTTDWTDRRDYTEPSRGRGGALDISGRSILPPAVTAGAVWPALALTMTASGGDVVLTSLEPSLLGTASGLDAPRAHLFADTDHDGEFTGADELVLGGEATFADGRYLISHAPLLIPEGRTLLLFVAVELSAAAVSGRTLGLSLERPERVESTAISVSGDFPLASELAAIAPGRGRGGWEAEEGWLVVALPSPCQLVPAEFESGLRDPGRGPSGGWPSSWTWLTNDSDNKGASFKDIDILSLWMYDDSNYIYFKINLEDLATLYINDEWNFYFKTNDSSNNNYDMWYRVSLRCTSTATPSFSSSLSSYTGSGTPDRGDSWTVNETNTGNSTLDGTMYGYWFDQQNDSVMFYVSKSSIYGNLLGPGNTTSVYADTWYYSNNKWRRYDRAPGANKLLDYTMIPEFGEILAPVAGSMILFALLRRAGWRRGRFIGESRNVSPRRPGCGRKNHRKRCGRGPASR
ncbi:MAG: tetratricopeptide repeat protein [Thermoplasmata archaeon]